jgi:2-iminoacetate synthase ThiH
MCTFRQKPGLTSHFPLRGLFDRREIESVIASIVPMGGKPAHSSGGHAD